MHAVAAVGAQCGQGGVYCDGRHLHGLASGVQGLFHPQSPRRSQWPHLRKCGGGRVFQRKKQH